MIEGLIGVDSAKEFVQIPIMLYSERYFQIRKSLSAKDEVEILLSLVQNLDIFVWNLYEVPRVNLAFIMHKLNVDPLVPPKK